MLLADRFRIPLENTKANWFPGRLSGMNLVGLHCNWSLTEPDTLPPMSVELDRSACPFRDREHHRMSAHVAPLSPIPL